jgi:hypothetical protein
MAEFRTWLEFLATVKAVSEALTSTVDLVTAIERYILDPQTEREAAIASVRYMTFSDKEVEALTDRLLRCADRFVMEGDGQQRRRCICSVLLDAKEGNGDEIPDIADMPKVFEQLRCDEFVERRFNHQ